MILVSTYFPCFDITTTSHRDKPQCVILFPGKKHNLYTKWHNYPFYKQKPNFRDILYHNEFKNIINQNGSLVFQETNCKLSFSH